MYPRSLKYFIQIGINGMKNLTMYYYCSLSTSYGYERRVQFSGEKSSEQLKIQPAKLSTYQWRDYANPDIDEHRRSEEFHQVSRHVGLLCKKQMIDAGFEPAISRV